MATIFSKFLTEMDVTRSLVIPTNFMGLIDFEKGRVMDMHVHDDAGGLWMFRCSVQQNGIVGDVLCVDWIEFVQHRNVKVEDKVIFVMEDEAMGGRMKIEVKRKIRLFGQDIWADVK
ncbi:hypothetical protein Patl1_27070 [Pistacia atlantica]|uniref:Uncharacterized protein n=1 Tax=Pistacia atlantica TaxID=434234 RepID=A0ACC1B2N3_9ROSI|nr:hypothetical protein Patl1_27070 [Pistacia atlantica]